MTEQDNHITPDQNTPDNNTTEQTTTQHNAPHYITKSPQHTTKNLPLQVLDSKTSGIDEDEAISVVDWDREQASGLMAAVMGEGVPLNEVEREEAVERYGNWQDDVLTPIEVPAVIQDWWKDEKGEI